MKGSWMVHRLWVRGALLLLLLSLLLSSLSQGCGRSIVSFDTAAGSLIRPVLDLELSLGADGNLRRLFHRIRWLEQLREWEIRLQLHSLATWLGSAREGRLKLCGTSCSRCYSGNESIGRVAMACYTREGGASFESLQDVNVETIQLQSCKLSGLVNLEAPTIAKQGGEAYITWDQVCFPAARKYNESVDGICMSGLSAFEVLLDSEFTPERTPARLDALWVTRVSIKEGVGDNKVERRLDGVVGTFFDSQTSPPNTTQPYRSAILIDEKNALYSNFEILHCKADNPLPAYRDCCGSFRILTSDGQHLCGFAGAGTPADKRASCWTGSLASASPITMGTFEVRCVKVP